MSANGSSGKLRIGLGARAVAFALTYAGAAWLGYILSTQFVAATFWPPAGLFVAVLLLAKPSERPFFLVAGIVANLCADLSFGRPLTLALGFAVANASMALIATALMRRFSGANTSIDSARSLWQFIFFAAVLAPVVSATMGTVTIALHTHSEDLAGVWAGWWSGDAASVILIGSLALVGASRLGTFKRASHSARTIDVLRIAIAVVVSAALAAATWALLIEGGGSTTWKFALLAAALLVGVLIGPFEGALALTSIAVASSFAVAAVSLRTNLLAGALALKVFQNQAFLVLSGVIVLSMSVSILENKRHLASEAALALAAEERAHALNKAQQFAHIGSWTWDIEKDSLDWSDEMYRLFGIDQASFAGSLSEVIETAIHPDDRGVVNQSNLSVINEGIPVPLKYRIVLPDGSLRVVWAEAGEAVRNDQGQVIQLHGTVQDITRLQEAEDHLEQALESIERVVSLVCEGRDPYTAGHQRRVAEIALRIADKLGMPADQVAQVRTASLLHDIGKISVPMDILTKSGKLTDIEYKLIAGHPETGYDIIRSARLEGPTAEIIYQHHERCDGSGYPRNLAAEDILPQAKVIMVADVVEAMMSNRPYRPALGIDLALAEIELGGGTRYDANVARACIACFREDGFAFSES